MWIKAYFEDDCFYDSSKTWTMLSFSSKHAVPQSCAVKRLTKLEGMLRANLHIWRPKCSISQVWTKTFCPWKGMVIINCWHAHLPSTTGNLLLWESNGNEKLSSPLCHLCVSTSGSQIGWCSRVRCGKRARQPLVVPTNHATTTDFGHSWNNLALPRCACDHNNSRIFKVKPPCKYCRWAPPHIKQNCGHRRLHRLRSLKNKTCCVLPLDTGSIDIHGISKKVDAQAWFELQVYKRKKLLSWSAH